MTPEDRARELLAGTAHFEALGLGELAAQARTVARDTLDLAEALEAERSARRALQARCETQQEILGKAVYRACVEAARDR